MPCTKNTLLPRRGFTLIELLIVVLLVGILAGIALPMYQRATDRAKVINFIRTAEGIQKAEERYFMANSQYVTDLRQLDVDFTNICPLRAGDPSILECDGVQIDNIVGTQATGTRAVSVHFCPTRGRADCQSNPEMTYTIYYAAATARAGQRACTYTTPRGRSLCESLQVE